MVTILPIPAKKIHLILPGVIEYIMVMQLRGQVHLAYRCPSQAATVHTQGGNTRCALRDIEQFIDIAFVLSRVEYALAQHHRDRHRVGIGRIGHPSEVRVIGDQ